MPRAGPSSLTPRRYVGVAPPDEDEDFDFAQTVRDIHTELAARSQANFPALPAQ